MKNEIVARMPNLATAADAVASYCEMRHRHRRIQLTEMYDHSMSS